jgi:hypothetical protein
MQASARGRGWKLRGIFLLLLGFLLGGLSYSLSTPIFEAPDEVWHYAYVRYLAEEHRLPSLSDNQSGAYQEAAQPPLYYAVAAIFSGAFSDTDLADLMWHNPGFGYQSGGTSNDNKNMLIHTEAESFPWKGAVLAIRVARMTSLVWGALTVLAAWGLGREAFHGEPLWSLAVSVAVAVTPQFLFMSGVVSNDTAAAAISTAAMWTISRMVTTGIDLRHSVLTGALIGLAGLTKTSTLLLLPLATLVVLLGSSSRRSRLVYCLAIILAATAVCGWWYARNQHLYGDPLGLDRHLRTPWGRTSVPTVVDLLRELPKVFQSFWGSFGWGHIMFPTWVYIALAVLVLTSLFGWLTAFRRLRAAVSLPITALSLAWCTLVFAALLQWMRQVEAPHGRLLFPAIGAWAVLLVAGWRLSSHRFLRPVSLAALAILSLAAPLTTIRPAFARPLLVQPDEVATGLDGPSLEFGRAARLVGHRLSVDTAYPGQDLSLFVCWQGIARMERDYTVFIQLLGQENERVAERYTYPGLGRFPTSLWPTGLAFCDQYRVSIEPWAPTPEVYRLAIGLFDADTGERLDTLGLDGAESDSPTLTNVRVVPAEPVEVEPQHLVDYTVGNGMSLIGYDLPSSIAPGTRVTATLYWKATSPQTDDYIAFVHILDQEGRLLAQHDAQPRDGRYPTLYWQAGDIIVDEHTVQLPADQWEGTVRLVAGMYDSETSERLSVGGGTTRVIDDLIPLRGG